MSAELAITVNGEPMRLPAGASVADLLERLRVSTPRVAVERNREILPKAEYPGTAAGRWRRVRGRGAGRRGIAGPELACKGANPVFSAPRVGR